MTTQGVIDLLSADPKVVLTLLAILILLASLASLSRQVLSFLGSILLAAISFLIFEFPNSLPMILAVGCALGSVLLSVVEIHRGRQLSVMRRELNRLSVGQTKLEIAESRRVMADMKSTHSARQRPALIDHAEAGKNATGDVAASREPALSA